MRVLSFNVGTMLHFFLGDDAVHDAKRTDLLGVRLSGRHQKVVGIGLRRVGDVGPGRVGLGRGMRVIDHHRLLVARIHVAIEPKQIHRVELVERR